MTGRGRQHVNGVLLLNKPSGMTSNRALQIVKRGLGAKKGGHTGSLDPAATGMLPLCFGEATKVCAFLLDADKTYRVVADLGKATDTGDADGRVAAERDIPALEESDWRKVLEGFLGASEQIPPMYSALKQGGKRLYELARRGEVVERPPRPIHIYEIALLEAHGRRLVFRVRCSKGTYIRTLVEDLAKAAGTVAHTAHLHRESVGPFAAPDMLDFAELEARLRADRTGVVADLLPVDSALAELPAVRLAEDDAQAFAAGRAVSAAAAPTGLVRVYGSAGLFYGVGKGQGGGRLAPKRVFLQAPEA